jgi:toxin secretion/phage lysis holin
MKVTVMGVTWIVTWILYVGLAALIDTVFGLGRAIKYRSWNSSVGIDGAIRKISMIACMAFMVSLDALCSFNLINLFPADVVQLLAQVNIAHAGFAEFFGILFVAYECVSILKNMYFCGLPVKWVWSRVYNFLHKYTDELPDTENIDLK